MRDILLNIFIALLKVFIADTKDLTNVMLKLAGDRKVMINMKVTSDVIIGNDIHTDSEAVFVNNRIKTQRTRPVYVFDPRR